jgi:hypothetical protein
MEHHVFHTRQPQNAYNGRSEIESLRIVIVRLFEFVCIDCFLACC